MSKNGFFIAGVCIFLFGLSCSHNPYTTTNRSYKKQAKAYAKILAQYPVKDSVVNAPSWIGATNFNMRKPNFVIIHHMLSDYLRAWQAGVSKWGNATDINSVSIGIEIDNNGFEPFTEEQINSLLGLLDRVKKAYSIPAANFIGHADIAPGRKVDPNKYFPWEKLAQNGFSLWYDTTGVQVPPDFNAMQALRIIGYDIKRPEAAIQSFKLHFVQSDSTKVINEEDKKILVDLVKKYQ